MTKAWRHIDEFFIAVLSVWCFRFETVKQIVLPADGAIVLDSVGIGCKRTTGHCVSFS